MIADRSTFRPGKPGEREAVSPVLAIRREGVPVETDKDYDGFWASNSTEQDVQLAVGKTVSAKVDSNKIDCLTSALVTGHRVCQHQRKLTSTDNHTAFVVTIYPTQNKNLVVPQPSYNPDIAPCDIFVPPTEVRAERKAVGVGGEHPR
ncbi:hypothetical protein J6590_087897 [Homalodisca vitripennis]|nr:hypothetical protein J6590_087897 [Homalodisca vitripennis]